MTGISFYGLRSAITGGLIHYLLQIEQRNGQLPDILVLTEVKLVAKRHAAARHALVDIGYSSVDINSMRLMTPNSTQTIYSTNIYGSGVVYSATNSC